MVQDPIVVIGPDVNKQLNKKTNEEYRNYEVPARDTVKEFYHLNHLNQTYSFVINKREQYLTFKKREMTVWEAFEFLNELIDDSDPDIDLDQFQHLLQTSEAIRRDGHPDWMVLVGLVHDLGKVLCLFGEEQWAVVGDTFPVGCAYSDKIVYSEFFKENEDFDNPSYNTKFAL
jgi:inositol oxygenase